MTAMPHQRSRTAGRGRGRTRRRLGRWPGRTRPRTARNPAGTAGRARPGPRVRSVRSFFVVAVVTGPVSRRAAAGGRSTRRPAVVDRWAVDRRLAPAVRPANLPPTQRPPVGRVGAASRKDSGGHLPAVLSTTADPVARAGTRGLSQVRLVSLHLQEVVEAPDVLDVSRGLPLRGAASAVPTTLSGSATGHCLKQALHLRTGSAHSP